MKKISEFLKKNKQMVITAGLTMLWVVIVIFIATKLTTGKDQGINANVWYWAIIVSYLIVWVVITQNDFNGVAHKVLTKVNIAIIIISLVGFILHFFSILPPPIQALCGWSAAGTFVLLLILMIVDLIFIGFNEAYKSMCDWDWDY